MKPRRVKQRKRGHAERAPKKRSIETHGGIQPDPLLEEVAEANARVVEPNEKARVIPSKPC